MKPVTYNLKLAMVFGSLAAFMFSCGEPDPNWINYRLPPARPVQALHLGAEVKDLVLTDTNETTHSIEAYRDHIVILDFWSCRCLYVEKSEKARQQLIAQYRPRGVVYLAMDSNRDEDPGEIKQYLAEHHSSYTVFVDYFGTTAKRFNATRTPQSFVLDHEGVMRFIGSPFSPEQWAKTEPDRADWLEAALDSLLAGSLPEPSTRPPSGSQIRLYRGP